MINAPGTKTFSEAFYGGTVNAEQYLKYLEEEIHTVVVAAVDDEGLPVTAAIDMTDFDEKEYPLLKILSFNCFVLILFSSSDKEPLLALKMAYPSFS